MMKIDNIPNVNDIMDNVEALYDAILLAIKKMVEAECHRTTSTFDVNYFSLSCDADSNKITYEFHRGLQRSYSGSIPIQNVALKLMENGVKIDTEFAHNEGNNEFFQKVCSEIIDQIELDVIRNFNIKNFRAI